VRAEANSRWDTPLTTAVHTPAPPSPLLLLPLYQQQECSSDTGGQLDDALLLWANALGLLT
jgi:hypothetical protein